MELATLPQGDRMRPNSKRHKPEPAYVRTLLERILARTGMDDEAVADRIGVHVRTLRRWYASLDTDKTAISIPYAYQFALEELARD